MSSINANEKLAKAHAVINAKKVTSLQLANANNDKTVIWCYSNFKYRLVSSVSIKGIIWRHIRPFAYVGDINKNSLTIQPIWSHFSRFKPYNLATTIACLVDFITLLAKNLINGHSPKSPTLCSTITSLLSLNHHQRSLKILGPSKVSSSHPQQLQCG